MHTMFHVDFRNQGEGGSLGFARLEVELPFAPSMDIEFAHPVWHDGRKPAAIAYILDDDLFYVTFPQDDLPNAAARPQHAEMYTLHGWTVTLA